MNRMMVTIGAAVFAAGTGAQILLGGVKPWEPRMCGTWRCASSRASAAEHPVRDMVLVGDSITHGWESKGKQALAEAFPGWDILTMGISGNVVQDQIGYCDWGGLDGYAVRVFHVMVGTNNAPGVPEETAKGIRRLLDVLKDHQPSAKIVLWAIFSRGKAGDRFRAANERVNAIIRNYADGEDVVWVDMNDIWVDENGDTIPELMSDGVHPTEKGYRLWAEAMKPLSEKLRALVKDPVARGKPAVSTRPQAAPADDARQQKFRREARDAEVVFFGDESVVDIRNRVMHRDPWTPEFYASYQEALLSADEPTEKLLGRISDEALVMRPRVFVVSAGCGNARARQPADEPPIDIYNGIRAIVEKTVERVPGCAVIVAPARIFDNETDERKARLEALNRMLPLLPRETPNVIYQPHDGDCIKAAIGVLLKQGGHGDK